MNDTEIQKRIKLHREFAYKMKLTSPLALNIDKYALLSPEKIKYLWNVFLKQKENYLLSLYIHIPYCYCKKCNYCMYNTKIIQDTNVFGKYLDYLKESMDFYGPDFKGHSFTTLYIGGGSPSLLSMDQLERLLSEIAGSFNLRNDGFRTIEIKPTRYTKENLDLAVNYGINRISIGVQSINEKVLKLANRDYAKPDDIKELVSYAGFLNFKEINVDLIAGLPGDDLNGFTNSFRLIASLGVSTISIYYFQLETINRYPKSELNKIRMLYKDNYVKSVLEAIYPVSKEYGYEKIVANANYGRQLFMQKDHHSDLCRHYTDWEPGKQNSLLGIGVGARSFIKGHVTFTDTGPSGAGVVNFTDYDFSRSVFYTTVCNEIDKMRRAVRLSLHVFKELRFADFEMTFKTKLMGVFLEEIEALASIGKIRVEEEKIVLTTNDMIDESIHLLFFCDHERIEHLCKKGGSMINVVS